MEMIVFVTTNVEDKERNKVKVKLIEIGHYIGVAWEMQVGHNSQSV